MQTNSSAQRIAALLLVNTFYKRCYHPPFNSGACNARSTMCQNKIINKQDAIYLLTK